MDSVEKSFFNRNIDPNSFFFNYQFYLAVDVNDKELSEEDKIYLEYYKRKQAFEKLPISKKSNLGILLIFFLIIYFYLIRMLLWIREKI